MAAALDVLGGFIQDQAYKAPCRAAATVDLSGAMLGLLVVDGVQTVSGDRILIFQNSDQTTNGIYNVNTGAWTRVIDFSNTSGVTRGTQVLVTDGDTYTGIVFELVDSDITFGTSDITFSIGPIPTNPVEYAFIDDFGGSPLSLDNTAAFNAAYASALATIPTSVCVVFGRGVYKFTSSITKTMTSTQSITIRGQGARVTELRFADGCGMTINYLDYTNSTHWQDLSITTEGVGTTIGVKLLFTGLNTNPALSAMTNFNGVEFRGADGWAVVDYWSVALKLDQVSNVLIDGCTFIGQAPVSGGYTGVGVGIHMLGSASNIQGQIIVANSLLDYWGIAVLLGSDTQGEWVSNCNINGCAQGIVGIPAAANLDQLTVNGSHFDTSDNGIKIESALPNMFITGSHFIVGPNGNGILITHSSAFSFVGNQFNVQPAPHGGQTYISIADYDSYGGVITGNVFLGATTGVYLQTNSQFVNVQSNVYSDCTDDVTDNGTNNTVGGGST